MKKQITMIFLFMLLVSGVSALACDASGFMGFSKLNENKTISITCPTCTYIKITATNPDGTTLFSNQAMSSNNQTFSYTFNETQNNQLGTYQISGISNLDEPLGICYETTFSGKENNVGSYVFGLIIIVSMIMGLVWLNKKYDYSKREALYKKLVVNYVNAHDKNSKSDMATMILYLIGYGLLRMTFVFYYLVVMLFMFMFKDFSISFGLNTFSGLMPELVKISLYGLVLVGFYLMGQIVNILLQAIRDIEEEMRGVWEK